MSGCCTLPESFKTQECGYMPPVVKTLWMRKNKNGQIQVKINKKGKWINAEYNEERKTITYLS